MKKYVLGIGIGIVFLVYSGILRHQHSEPVIAPASLSDNTTSNSSTSNNPPITTTTVEYKDGTYDGSVTNAFYGNVQVSVTILSGKISAVNFLQSPNENPNSIYVNQAAMPYLKQEAIKAQSSNISIVTGATFTSQAFIGSLSNALNQAKQGI
jgi:uncharacterized protein with FMN-binding domain